MDKQEKDVSERNQSKSEFLIAYHLVVGIFAFTLNGCYNNGAYRSFDDSNYVINLTKNRDSLYVETFEYNPERKSYDCFSAVFYPDSNLSDLYHNVWSPSKYLYTLSSYFSIDDSLYYLLEISEPFNNVVEDYYVCEFMGCNYTYYAPGIYRIKKSDCGQSRQIRLLSGDTARVLAQYDVDSIHSRFILQNRTKYWYRESYIDTSESIKVFSINRQNIIITKDTSIYKLRRKR